MKVSHKLLKRKVKGFTLIEMVVVIAIIAMLILLIAPNLFSYRDKANNTANDAFIKTVQMQVDLYKDEYGKNITVSDMHDKNYLTDNQVKKIEANHITIKDGKVIAPKN